MFPKFIPNHLSLTLIQNTKDFKSSSTYRKLPLPLSIKSKVLCRTVCADLYTGLYTWGYWGGPLTLVSHCPHSRYRSISQSCATPPTPLRGPVDNCHSPSAQQSAIPTVNVSSREFGVCCRRVATRAGFDSLQWVSD